jgi:cadmium resistance protein CadD (predicted permease)
MASADAGIVAWITGFLMLLPFLAGLASTLAADAGPSRWLAPVMTAGGSIAVALQLVVAGVGHVANNVSKASPVHEPLHAAESALLALTLLPLGLALTAAAAAMLRHHRVPRWLGYATAVVAVVLLGNGMMLGTEQLPGLLAFLVWTFICGIALMATRRDPASDQHAHEPHEADLRPSSSLGGR